MTFYLIWRARRLYRNPSPSFSIAEDSVRCALCQSPSQDPQPNPGGSALSAVYSKSLPTGPATCVPISPPVLPWAGRRGPSELTLCRKKQFPPIPSGRFLTEPGLRICLFMPPHGRTGQEGTEEFMPSLSQVTYYSAQVTCQSRPLWEGPWEDP